MTLLRDLAAALGAAGCLTGADIGAGAVSDASGTGRIPPLALLRPASVNEVSAALEICHRHGVGVVPQGGMTGLAGGANPQGGDVALSLTRFAGVEEIDPDCQTITLRAGTTLQAAQEAAAAAGFLLPVDLGSRGSCQIGGIVATNAGGVRVIRHGMTRDNLAGVEAVLADGTVLSSLTKVVKNNTGYDLRHLICGSEGTLAVITRAVLRLRPLPGARATALCALPDFAAVLALLKQARTHLPGLSAFEAMWRDYVLASSAAAGLQLFPDPPPFTVLIEAEGSAGGLDAEFEAMLAGAFEAGILSDALIAQSQAEAARFWTLREGHALDRMFPGLINLDIALPVALLDDYATACGSAIRARFPDAHVSFYGHVGDMNLHVAVGLTEPSEAAAHEVDRIAYDLVRERGGSVSAEHGIGVLKRDWLGHSRSAAEIAQMRAVKAAFDPKGVMNPGKVV
ncbi:FAD-binding oxidoreductase [Szabonella alba]|uniref:FAD-binding oxidoreductase n=1 Tax=Szabonella alba TaxID=2804194 RepID=A0A8K0VAH9_9RHOB|nr:FAD-binding oxidoreductase [Szabonella alba]MBL4916633.1 FAD-binding oxidoreductase [Szabonella alba]